MEKDPLSVSVRERIFKKIDEIDSSLVKAWKNFEKGINNKIYPSLLIYWCLMGSLTTLSQKSWIELITVTKQSRSTGLVIKELALYL